MSTAHPLVADCPAYASRKPLPWFHQAWSCGEREAVRAQLRLGPQDVHDSAAAVALAHYAAELSEPDVHEQLLELAIALDRDNKVALLAYAALLLERGDHAMLGVVLEEAHRIEALPPALDAMRNALGEELGDSAEFAPYFRAIGRSVGSAPTRLRVLVVTNLFPPEELGGYGRSMWEFAHGMLARGHEVRVLTANVPSLAKTPSPEEVLMEKRVHRTLELTGTWNRGEAVTITDRSEIVRRTRDNSARVRTAVAKFEPDLLLVGNVDYLGISIVRPALDMAVPVIQSVGNSHPGYTVQEQPTAPNYCMAPCSDWRGMVMMQAGFTPARLETLYPGARIDRFFRLFLPDTRRLRICYAGLVMPFKGVHTLIAALARLQQAGIEFTAEIAGQAPDAEFFARLQAEVRAADMESRVCFAGFLDRKRLSALFARSNILVFPTIVEEGFGISQVEAMAAGLVVVSSGTGGAREVVRDGVDGLLFSPGDASDLVAKLVGLARDAELMRQLQRAAQARATTFSVDNSVLKLERLTDEIQMSVAAAQAEALADMPTS